MTRPTLPGATRPLVSAGSLDGGGGTIVGPVESGLVPTSTGSNSWLWLENVRRITANGSNTILGPFVNVAAGSNIILTVDQFPASTPSNTLRIHSTGGGGGSLTVEDEGTPLATSATTLNFVGAGVTATGTGTTKTITIPGGAGGSGLTLLEQHTASSSATLDFTTFISSTYDEYLFEGVGVVPATDAVNLLARVGTGGGPTYDSANNYFGTLRGSGSSAGTSVQTDGGASAVMVAKVINVLDSGYGQVNFTLRFTQPQDTSKMKHLYGLSTWHDGTEQFMGVVGYIWGVTTTITAVRFLMSSGNIASGVIRVYGIEK